MGDEQEHFWLYSGWLLEHLMNPVGFERTATALREDASLWQKLDWLRSKLDAALVRAAQTREGGWVVCCYSASGQSVARIRYPTLAQAEAEIRRWEATGTGRCATIEETPNA